MSLAEMGQMIAGAKPPEEPLELGPWQGSMRSKSADQVPLDFLPGGNDFHYQPRTGTWKRRGGQVQKFDAFGAAVGMMAAKWGARARQIEEFVANDSLTSDGIPTVCAKVTKETIAAGLDDGIFGSYWVRDQVSGANYQLGSEFSALTYPVPGTAQAFKHVPLWNGSGDGMITRGPAEFQRRFYGPGSRKSLKAGNWLYEPGGIYGTPFRWDRNRASASQTAAASTATLNTFGSGWAAVGGTATAVITDSDDATYDRYVDFGPSGNMAIDFAALTTTTSVSIKLTLRTSVGANQSLKVSLVNADASSVELFDTANRYYDGAAGSNPGALRIATLTDSFVEYTLVLSPTEVAAIHFSSHLILTLGAASGTGGHTIDVSKVELFAGSSSTVVSRLIPSGPLPPLHAGTIAKGEQTESNSTYARPNADVTDGSFLRSDTGLAVDLYSVIDEATISDTDYIRSDAGHSGDVFEVALADLGVTPAADETVVIRFRVRTNGSVTVHLMEGANIRSGYTTTPASGVFVDLTKTLTASDISSVTAWTDLRLRFTKASSVLAILDISYAALDYSRPPSTLGGWRGSDKFYYSVAFEFEDGSIWMPCTPRGPNAILADGYNLFTVDPSNLSAAYQKITWSNIPIGPYGTKRRHLLRSLKIDSSTESTLQLNPRDLRVVKIIEDNVTTTYDDFFASDGSLVLDPGGSENGFFIRYDHKMPPRSRYIFGGDSRVCVSYGGESPCAVEFAPVGYAAAFDRNLVDTDAALFGSTAFYYRVTATALELISDSGSAIATTTLDFATYDTLEKLVDAINATTIAGSGKQWRAQLCPNASSQANPVSKLTLTTRAITSCVVAGQSITKAAGGMSAVAVGSWIQGTGTTDGAYVSAIVSDTQLTFVGTVTAATKTLTFNAATGDAPTGGTAYQGYVRALGGCLPSFLYFNNTHLDEFPIEKSTVWMTVATPGVAKSAPNLFSKKTDNRHVPPLEAGISMGGFAVDNGFVVPMSNKNCVIRNTRDAGTGADQDYKIIVLNETRGCCAWGSVTPATRSGFFFSPEGWVACDLFREILISKDVWLAPDSDASTGTGDYDYEAPQSVQATHRDTDASYLMARVTRGRLWVNYRTSASPAHPNRQVNYPFSDGESDTGGLDSLTREDGRPFGWSLPAVRSMSAMCEGHRSDGAHLYGWNDLNAGSTGDGRIDEFETGDTDNGTVIAATAQLSWIQAGDDKLSVQEALVWHSAPAGSTGAFEFWRGFANAALAQSMTLNTSSTLLVIRDRKPLQTTVRPVTEAAHFRYTQATGAARELRKVLVKAIRTRDMKPAA